MAFSLAKLAELMSEARHNVVKLRVVMIYIGLLLSVAALSLIIFQAPGGILLRLHGNTPGLLYYGTLIATVMYGFVEASVGYWVVPRDDPSNGWCTIGKTMLWFSIVPFAIVAALGGSVFLKY